MALVDLKTTLKSLRFGGTNPAYSDRTGAGFSNQPFIVKTIPQDLVADDLKQKEYDPKIPTLLPDNSIDFLTRGGILESARIDSERLTRFFDPFTAGSSPNGALFIAKQEVLSQLSPKILGVNSEVNILNNQNIYSPYNTIAQVLANGTPGLHLNKQGVNPFIFSNKFGYDYATTEAEQPVDDNSGNGRLKLLYQLKVAKNEGEGIISVAKDFYGISKDPNELFQYIGGPGGPRTLISIAKGSETVKDYKAPDGTTINNVFTFSSARLSTKSDSFKFNINTLSDFRREFFDNAGNYVLPVTDYEAFNRETTYKTSQTYFQGNSRYGVTKILNPNLAVSPDSLAPDDQDIIDFSFSLINNDTGNDTFLNFRAYIDDFSDSFNADWEAYKYIGRAESFYRYKGFTRDFNVTFNIPALSRADVITNYQKLNALTWATLPDYSKAGLMRGNLVYFTMGDYLRESIVTIKSLTFNPIFDMGFDINRAEDGTIFSPTSSLYTGQLPKGIKVTCNMIPLTHNMNIGKDDKPLFFTPQRGEALIGNRKHVIIDRPNIADQYEETTGSLQTSYNNKQVFAPNDPNLSLLYDSTSGLPNLLSKNPTPPGPTTLSKLTVPPTSTPFPGTPKQTMGPFML